MPKATSSSTSRRLALAGWIALPAILLLVLLLEPAPPHLCLWSRFLGVRCPGCGLHHAAFLGLRGHWHQAWSANPLVFAVAPLGVGLYLHHLRRLWLRVFPKPGAAG